MMKSDLNMVKKSIYLREGGFVKDKLKFKLFKMLNLNGKSILITGGTGSFGKMFTKLILEKNPNVGRLVILSRDEQKHYRMSMEFPEDKYPSIRYFVGDVRDKERLERAFVEIDIVIPAAMKHVDISEYNPSECIRTNIVGAENVISASMKCNVENVVALSTDKSLCSNKFIWGN